MRKVDLPKHNSLSFPVNLDLKGVFRSLSVGALEETDGTNESDFVPLPEKYFREKAAEQCWEKSVSSQAAGK